MLDELFKLNDAYSTLKTNGHHEVAEAVAVAALEQMQYGALEVV